MLFITRSNGTFVNKDVTSSEIMMWFVGIFVFEMTSLKINEFFTCKFGDGKGPLRIFAFDKHSINEVRFEISLQTDRCTVKT